MRQTHRALVVAGSCVLALAGCASTQEPEVVRVATAFEDASGDPRTRCDLLTPRARERLEKSGSTCGEQLADLPLGAGDGRVGRGVGR